MTDSENVTVKKADISALDPIMAIENEAFEDPWSRPSMIQELKDNDFGCYFIVQRGAEIIGYCGYWRVLEEAQITNIAIAADFRGQGYGKKLLMYVMLYAARHGAESMTLEVRPSNARAIALYESLGFVTEGVRKRYYSNNGEDALIMWNRRLQELPGAESIFPV